MCVETGVQVPSRIVKFTTEDEIDTVNAIPHYKKKGEEQNKLRRHRQVNDANE